jgi:hypothetical protein
LLTNPSAVPLIKPSLTWYRLQADGTPVKSGEVFGKGLSGSAQTPYEGVLAISGDGKSIYTISSRDQAIACIERKSDGAIAWRNAIDLAEVAKSGKHSWASLFVSPEGKWVYGQLWGYGKPAENRYGIFARSAETGELKFKEAINGVTDPLAQQRGWQQPLFFPDGRAFLGRYDLGLWNFRYDATTGRLSDAREVKETKGYRASVAYDQERGFVYLGGVWIVEGGIQDGFRVLKMEKRP